MGCEFNGGQPKIVFNERNFSAVEVLNLLPRRLEH